MSTNETDSIERLRRSRKEYDDTQRAAGREQGARWAADAATWAELRDISAWHDHEDIRLEDGHSLAYWLNNMQVPDLDMSEPYWQGFVETAEEYREKVRPEVEAQCRHAPARGRERDVQGRDLHVGHGVQQEPGQLRDRRRLVHGRVPRRNGARGLGPPR
jgi:hypothetical protein